jgi:hypothetical protein
MKTIAILNNLKFYTISSLLLSGVLASCGSLNNTTSLAEYDGIYDDDFTFVDPPAEVVINEVEAPNYFSLEYDRLSAYEDADYFTDIDGYTTPYDDTYTEADSLPGNYTISEPWGHESAQTVSINVYNTRGFMYANPYYNGFYQFGFGGFNPYFPPYWGGGIYPPYWEEDIIHHTTDLHTGVVDYTHLTIDLHITEEDITDRIIVHTIEITEIIITAKEVLLDLRMVV